MVLDLICTAVADITALATCVRLTNLSLKQTDVTDVSSLVELEHLGRLDVTETSIPEASLSLFREEVVIIGPCKVSATATGTTATPA